jgi:hypothetical protein
LKVAHYVLCAALCSRTPHVHACVLEI